MCRLARRSSEIRLACWPKRRLPRPKVT
jgi:hypothetical protein